MTIRGRSYAHSARSAKLSAADYRGTAFHAARYSLDLRGYLPSAGGAKRQASYAFGTALRANCRFCYGRFAVFRLIHIASSVDALGSGCV